MHSVHKEKMHMHPNGSLGFQKGINFENTNKRPARLKAQQVGSLDTPD